METLDWVKLANEVVQESGKVLYKPNKHLFTKVAFDVFQLNNSPIESLWQLENDENGKPFLVAMYNDEDSEDKLMAKSSWNTLSDKSGQNITLLYKDMPIHRFASNEYGFNKDDVHIFQNTLLEKLNSDSEFRQKLLNSKNEEVKNQILKKFPELA